MLNKFSKVRAKCMEAIRNKPGILRSELYSMDIGYSKDGRNPILKDAHGDKFYMAFDEAFGLLYIDLKILGMAAQELMI